MNIYYNIQRYLWMSYHILKIMFFIIIVSIQAKGQFPPYVWIVWDKGFDHVPPFLNECLMHNKRMLNNSKWQIREVAQSNYKQLFTEQELVDLNVLFQNAPPQSKIDYMRLMLLNKYGGVYMDISGYLLEDLDWLNDLSNNPHQMYQTNQTIEFFLFLCYDQVYDLFRTRNAVCNRPKFQNSFMAAMPNSTFGMAWMKKFAQMAKKLIQTNKTYRYFLSYESNRAVVLQKVKQIETGIDKINKNYGQALKLGSINCRKGLYDPQYYSQFSRWQDISVKITKQQLKDRFNFTRRYYNKQNHWMNQFLTAFFQKDLKAERDFNVQIYPIYYFLQGLLSHFQSFRCLARMFFLEGSYSHEIFINQANYDPERVFKKEKLPLLCQYNLSIQQLLWKIFFFSFFPTLFLIYFYFKPRTLSKDNSSQYKISQSYNNINKHDDDDDEAKMQQNGQIERIPNTINLIEIIRAEGNIFEKKVLLFLVSVDILEKILFIVHLYNTSSFIILIMDVATAALLVYICEKSIPFWKKLIFDYLIVTYLICWIFLQQQIPRQIVDGNSFHQNVVLRITILQNFMLLYFIEGYVTFRIGFTVFEYTKLRS